MHGATTHEVRAARAPSDGLTAAPRPQPQPARPDPRSARPDPQPAPRRHGPPDGAAEAEPTWQGIGLGTMAAMLVLSLRRVGSHGFEARCQWPRLHPLNERGLTVVHHPLIMAESLRQLAVALERRHLAPAATTLEPVSVSLGLAAGAQPRETGDATAVAARLAVSDVLSDGAGLAGFRVSADFLHGGLRFGSCTMRLARRARDDDGDRAPAGDHSATGALHHPAAAAVGAAAEPDVMLARAWQGRLVLAPRDPGHPVLLAGRPTRLPALAVLEAGRQAALLSCGMTAASVTGLSVELRGPAAARAGALVEVTAESLGPRFAVLARGQVAATGTVALLKG